MIPRFRAIYKSDKPNYLMFHQEFIDNHLWFVMDKDNDFKYPFEIPFIDDEWILMQSIGLKDKNGNEIYEGDIIDILGDMYIVEFNQHTSSYIAKAIISENNSKEIKVIKDLNNNIEVIGNIYENPKLIKRYKTHQKILNWLDNII